MDLIECWRRFGCYAVAFFISLCFAVTVIASILMGTGHKLVGAALFLILIMIVIVIPIVLFKQASDRGFLAHLQGQRDVLPAEEAGQAVQLRVFSENLTDTEEVDTETTSDTGETKKHKHRTKKAKKHGASGSAESEASTAASEVKKPTE